MNVYFLVEGQRTEAQVYPAWLTELLPSFKQVDRANQATRHCYFLVSGYGYPSVVQETLKNAIADVNDVGNYNYLVICLDADDLSPEERLAEIHEIIEESQRGEKAAWKLRNAELKFIIQHRTIETWFLGNRKIVSDAPQGSMLRKYLTFHDVRVLDPEIMKLHSDYEHHAEFHHEYLKEVFREKGINYRKRDPGHVKDKTYLDQLLSRVNTCPQDLKSFQTFVGFCREVERLSQL